MRERGRSTSHTKACSVTPVNFVSLNYSQQQFVLSSGNVILGLLKDIHKSISWSAKKRQLPVILLLGQDGSFLTVPENHT